MDIVKARDSMGNEITPVPEFITGFVRYAYSIFLLLLVDTKKSPSPSHPKRFDCDFRPRNAKSAEVIRRMSINIAH